MTLPSNKGPILGWNGFMFGLSFLVVALRAYVRHFLKNSFGIDDSIMIAAAMTAIGTTVCVVMEVKHGVGTHRLDVSASDYAQFRFWQYVHGSIVVTGISLVRFSVGFHLLRFVQGKRYRLSIYVMLGLLVMFTLVSDLTLLLQCIPVSASWIDKTATGVKCFSNATFANIGMCNGVINIVTDISFVVLPMPVVLALKVNKRTKTTLVLILSLGLFACVASTVRVYLMSVYFADPDPLWHYSFFLWNFAELYIGIIAASLPTLRPLFTKVLDGTSKQMYKYDDRNTTVYPRGQYFRQDDIALVTTE